VADDQLGRGGTGGPSGRFWFTAVVIVIAAIFLLQNSQKVTVDFIFSSTETPLIFALLIAFVLGFIVGLALPRFRRPRD
jgi:uncharacterized integral membrane protein